MIRVYVYRRKNGQIIKLAIAGHSGYAPRGRDVVCAAVSGGAWVLAGGFKSDAELKGCFRQRSSSAFMLFELKDGLSEASRIKGEGLLDGFCLFINALQKQYTRFITVFERRC